MSQKDEEIKMKDVDNDDGNESEEILAARKDSGIDYEGDEVKSNADSGGSDSESIHEKESDLQREEEEKEKAISSEERIEKERLLKEEENLFEAQRQLQLKSLEEIKHLVDDEENEIDEDDVSDDRKKNQSIGSRRLEFLMAQSDIFTSFLMGGTSAMGKAMASKKKNKTKGLKDSENTPGSPSRRQNKKKQNKEEAADMAMQNSSARFTRLEKQPNNIAFGTMKPYQLEGLNWMIKLHDSGVNGILADEMGLGKTLQSISLLAYLREARGMDGPHLIIVPKSTVGNWMKELHRWCPDIRTFKFMGRDKEERIRLRDRLKNPSNLSFDACVLSYEIAIIEKNALRKISWQYMMIDEAHRIKNEKSKLSQVVREYNVKHRLLITGTPLQNNLHELWALLNFLLPDVFTDSEDFDSWFNVDGDVSSDIKTSKEEEQQRQQNVVKRLHTVLRPFLLRRLKTDVEHSLPPKTETKLYIGLSEMQRSWYTRILQRDATHLNSIGGSDSVRLLNILMQLRKVCNHPYLFDGAEPGPPYIEGPHLWENGGKMQLLHKLLPKLKEQQSRVLIFCQMTSLLDILEDYMRYHGYGYCRIDGSTSGEARDQQMEDFNAPESPLFAFLLSTRAGGLGINLATADIVILFDSDWNPQVDLQAMDRAHRIGQLKPVRVFRLITEGTVEEKIVERAERKLYLDAAVIQQGRLAEQNRKLSKEELMTMVRFGADEIFKKKSGAKISDLDIEAILARGEERTEAMKDKIEADMQHNLKNFTLSSASDVSNLYTFEGEDFAKEATEATLFPSTFISLPERERKKNYNVDEYFRQKQDGNSSKKTDGAENGNPNEPTEPKMPVLYEYQFYRRKDRMLELLTKKNQLDCQKQKINRQLKELKKAKQSPEIAVTSDGDSTKDPTVESLEKELAGCELSAAEVAEMEEIEAESFGSWARRDYKRIVACCERHGRKNVDEIVQDASQQGINKTDDQIRDYVETLLTHGPKLLPSDWPKIEERIARGERKIQRNRLIHKALATKCARHKNPWQDMKLTYPPGYKNRGYTLEEDIFLVCMMNKHGCYSNNSSNSSNAGSNSNHTIWNDIKEAIRGHWRFRFDWFLKSRTSSELQKRGDFLIRIIERENEEVQKHAKSQEKALRAKVKNSKRSNTEGKEKSSSAKKSRKR